MGGLFFQIQKGKYKRQKAERQKTIPYIKKRFVIFRDGKQKVWVGSARARNFFSPARLARQIQTRYGKPFFIFENYQKKFNTVYYL